MEEYLENLKLAVPSGIGLIDFVQIAILFAAILFLIDNLRNTRGWILVKGLLFIGIAYAIFYLTGMVVLESIVESLFNIIIIAVVIMFQPELQRLIERMGTNKIKDIFTLLKKEKEKESYYSERTVSEIVQACETMSEKKTGALIVIERDIPLTEYIESGISMKAEISSQLILNTFEKNTPLHDGAVIIKNNLIEAATCYLPLSSSKGIHKSLGTRHRAGIGVSEKSDSVVVVVSEETGGISVCVKGKIKENLDRTKLYDILAKESCKENGIRKKGIRKGIPFSVKAVSLLASVVLWAIIVNVEDPVITRTYTDIPVEILNEDVLRDLDQTYDIIKGESVDVTVKGHRSEIETINKDEITAIADIREMSITYAVPISVESENHSDVQIEIDGSGILELQLEELVSIELPVTVEITGEPDPLCYFSSASVSENAVVYGPKTAVGKISRAVASVDISGISESETYKAEITLYDRNGEEISSKKIETENEYAEITTEIFKSKEVPVIITTDSSSDYRITDYEEKTVYLAGNEELLSKTDEFVISVNSEQIDVNSKTILVNLELYLPDGLYLPACQENSLEIEIEAVKRK